ncbi:cytochrome P450 71A1-like [Selaginella moellendorffii]|uniref:cytochrome P450 71A1-like n=1 Tax=Selaginella moellendorffii TaxID=88036 RepID=UPI000D1C51E9|nr:cytochrome P450 71A1-like [Selaginella moellendorffii]|eukprot:XP_024537078.1 cytochrome P450 71A1-like [Selaginella moellendorffii]
MDSLLLELPLVAFIVSLFCFILNRFSRSKQHFSLPPSPPALPVIGHLHLIGDLPHHSMLELSKKYGEFMFLKLGSLNTLVVSSPDAAKIVLKTLDPEFAMKPEHLEAKYASCGGRGIIFAQYGEHWRQARKLCTVQLLSTKRVESAEPNRKLEMGLLLTDLWKCAEDGAVVNLTNKLSDFAFNVMLKMVTGKSHSSSASSTDEEEQARSIKDGLTEFVREGTGMHIATFFPWLKWVDKQVYKLVSVHKRVDKILQSEIDRHREKLGNSQASMEQQDFIDVMLMESDANDANIKAMTVDVLAASTDTASITSEWAISELLNHPAALAKVQAELDEVIGQERTMQESDIRSLTYLQAVINETLRLHPPVPIYPRENSAQACMISAKWGVPARTRVFINAYAIGRDETLWKEAHRFKPERFLEEKVGIDARGQDFELIPFGAGRRMCPGMQLGLTNVMLAVGSLLHAFNWIIPGADSSAGKVDMQEHFGMTVARAVPLQLLPVPRLPAHALALKPGI